jgi:hypothetical protein
MSTLTHDSLELAQLVKDVIDAKRALASPELVRALVGDDDGNAVEVDGELLLDLVSELFTAIDKLEAFYSTGGEP